MKRRIYIICQKRYWNKGKPQILSDDRGKLLYVFGSNEGKKRAEELVKRLNKNKCWYTKQEVHLRKGWIEL